MTSADGITRRGLIARSGARAIMAGLWAVQAIVVTLGVSSGNRFQTLTIAPAVLVLIVLLVYLAAIAASLLPSRFGRPALRILCFVMAAGVSVRFLVPLLLLPPALNRSEVVVVEQLRRLSAAQEQHRINAGAYTDDLTSIEGLVPAPASAITQLVASGDSGWAATMRFEGASCAVRVRVLVARGESVAPDGVPTCERNLDRQPNQHVRVLPIARAEETAFDAADIFGSWQQHRATADRSGRGTGGEREDEAGPSWTTRIAGELRASAAVAGNQVIVGAHGNGELVALHRSTGTVGWRIRLPNWIHHEPAIGADVVVATFGNNEYWQPAAGQPVLFGTPPSGVAVLTRSTGTLRWIRYSDGSMMGAPVLIDGRVMAVSSLGIVRAWRVADGTLEWESAIDSMRSAPMSNPVVADSLLVVSAEPGRWCLFDVRNGRRIRCRSVSGVVAGFGHSSPAMRDRLLVQVGIGAPDRVRFAVSRIAQRLFMIPMELMSPPRGAPQDIVIVGSDVENGDTRWKIVVSGRSRAIAGHIAGTPVFADSSIYIPLPTIGVVVALDARDGRVRWRSEVEPARGSVSVIGGRIFSATTTGAVLNLDAISGRELCRSELPGVSDRAGLTNYGGSGILTLTDGTVISAPLRDWARCLLPVR